MLVEKFRKIVYWLALWWSIRDRKRRSAPRGNILGVSANTKPRFTILQREQRSLGRIGRGRKRRTRQEGREDDEKI